jgi:hypothetical protein
LTAAALHQERWRLRTPDDSKQQKGLEGISHSVDNSATADDISNTKPLKQPINPAGKYAEGSARCMQQQLENMDAGWLFTLLMAAACQAHLTHQPSGQSHH